MLPCKKITNGSYATRWIKYAETLAHSIKKRVGTRKRFFDGCLIEGRRVNKNLAASVIDIHGLITFMLRDPATGKMVNHYQSGTRDFADPLNFGSTLNVGGKVDTGYTAITFGEPPPAGASRNNDGQCQAGKHAVYYSDTYEVGGVSWIRIIADNVGMPDKPRSILINESVVGATTEGYYLKSKTGLNIPTPVVAEQGNYVYLAIPVSKLVSESPNIEQQAILMLRVDVQNNELVSSLVPISELPDHLMPADVTRTVGTDQTITYPTRSRFSPLDITASSGKLVIAFSYELTMQDTPVYGEVAEMDSLYPSPVECYGRAILSGSSWSIVIDSVEADVTTDSQLLIDLGLDLDVVRLRGIAFLIGESSIRCRRVRKRKEPGDFSPHSGAAPYAEELLNGSIVGTALTGGYGVLFDGRSNTPLSGTITSIGTNKADISPTAVALARANADASPSITKSTGGGILFTDGSEFVYEPISDVVVEAIGTTVPMWISCPQQEVRGANGELVIPAVIIVSTVSDGRPVIAIRKGPIWARDYSDKFPKKEWKVTPTPYSSRAGATYYLGNRFMKKLHGELFYAKAND